MGTCNGCEVLATTQDACGCKSYHCDVNETPDPECGPVKRQKEEEEGEGEEEGEEEGTSNCGPCPNAPRPTCNGCEVLATRQDACGCKSYLCDINETPDPECGPAKRQKEEEEEEGTSNCGPCPKAPRPTCNGCEVLATRQDACGCKSYLCDVNETPDPEC